MDELFSCRNCIHNSGQSLLIAEGLGFCLQHNSVIRDPDRTTCKYLHRKDLPNFVVHEGIGEHAAEFAGFPLQVSLDSNLLSVGRRGNFPAFSSGPGNRLRQPVSPRIQAQQANDRPLRLGQLGHHHLGLTVTDPDLVPLDRREHLD